MIEGKDILWQTRLLAGDSAKAKYSDYEVFSAVNTAVDILCEYLRKYFSPELLRSAALEPEDGTCALPENFLYLEEASADSCRIEGDSIVCDAGETDIGMTYGKHPGRVMKDDDSLDLAAGFTYDLAYGAASLLRGETDAAEERLKKAAYEKAPDKRGAIPDEGMWPA